MSSPKRSRVEICQHMDDLYRQNEQLCDELTTLHEEGLRLGVMPAALTHIRRQFERNIRAINADYVYLAWPNPQLDPEKRTAYERKHRYREVTRLPVTITADSKFDVGSDGTIFITERVTNVIKAENPAQGSDTLQEGYQLHRFQENLDGEWEKDVLYPAQGLLDFQRIANDHMITLTHVPRELTKEEKNTRDLSDAETSDKSRRIHAWKKDEYGAWHGRKVLDVAKVCETVQHASGKFAAFREDGWLVICEPQDDGAWHVQEVFNTQILPEEYRGLSMYGFGFVNENTVVCEKDSRALLICSKWEHGWKVEEVQDPIDHGTYAGMGTPLQGGQFFAMKTRRGERESQEGIQVWDVNAKKGERYVRDISGNAFGELKENVLIVAQNSGDNAVSRLYRVEIQGQPSMIDTDAQLSFGVSTIERLTDSSVLCKASMFDAQPSRLAIVTFPENGAVTEYIGEGEYTGENAWVDTIILPTGEFMVMHDGTIALWRPDPSKQPGELGRWVKETVKDDSGSQNAVVGYPLATRVMPDGRIVVFSFLGIHILDGDPVE
jgi:hypothetical protein